MTVQRMDVLAKLKNDLVQAIFVYIAYSGLSYLSRFVVPLFPLLVVFGIIFPLVWARSSRDWHMYGFTRHSLGRAMFWGLGAGLACAAYIFFSGGGKSSDPMLAVQLLVGIPLAILFISPFQEFLFRGWLQTKLERALGQWPALFLAAIGFAVWHLFPPFEGSPTSSISVSSVGGLLTTLGLGLVFGYIFQRTRNIIAPWIAHALAIVATLVTGGMVLVHFVP